jgi:hypothetical protein
MVQDFLVVAAGFLEGVGKFRKAVECTVLVDVSGKGDYIGR